jgi:DNA-binding XRE family transcriptional regulator
MVMLGSLNMARRRNRAHWVEALRVDLGLTRTEMADELGVDRTRICQLENQGGTLKNDKLLRVWRRHRERLIRLGYEFHDLLTAKPGPMAA